MRALTLALCLFLAGTLFAQPKTVAPKTKTLVDFRTEIGLSEEQVQTVNKTLELFKTSLKTYQDKLLANEKELQILLAQKADLERVKTALRLSSDLLFQMQYLDVVTSRKVEAIMTPEQLKKWQDIQQKLKAEKK